MVVLVKVTSFLTVLEKKKSYQTTQNQISSVSFFFTPFFPKMHSAQHLLLPTHFKNLFQYSSFLIALPPLLLLTSFSLLLKIFIFCSYFCALSYGNESLHSQLLVFFLLSQSCPDTEQSKQRHIFIKRNRRKGCIFIFIYFSGHNVIKLTKVSIKDKMQL